MATIVDLSDCISNHTSAFEPNQHAITGVDHQQALAEGNRTQNYDVSESRTLQRVASNGGGASRAGGWSHDTK